MTREERIELIKHLKYNRSIGADYSITDKDVDEIIKSLEPEPCEDCISRQEVLGIIRFEDKWLLDAKGHNADTEIAFSGMKSKVSNLPSVTPQQKMGWWIKSTGYDDRDHFYSCSECGRNINLICGAKLADYPYCHCGAKMKEVEENDD